MNEESKIVEIPTFELASNPTISIREMEERSKNGTMGQLKITDTVSGKVTTIDQMFDSLNTVFDKVKVSKKQRSNFWKNMTSLKGEI